MDGLRGPDSWVNVTVQLIFLPGVKISCQEKTKKQKKRTFYRKMEAGADLGMGRGHVETAASAGFVEMSPRLEYPELRKWEIKDEGQKEES